MGMSIIAGQSGCVPINAYLLHSDEMVTPIDKRLLVMMLMMRMIVTIRTGRYAPLSTPRFTRMPAAGLAQNNPPPEIAR